MDECENCHKKLRIRLKRKITTNIICFKCWSQASKVSQIIVAGNEKINKNDLEQKVYIKSGDNVIYSVEILEKYYLGSEPLFKILIKTPGIYHNEIIDYISQSEIYKTYEAAVSGKKYVNFKFIKKSGSKYGRN